MVTRGLIGLEPRRCCLGSVAAFGLFWESGYQRCRRSMRWPSTTFPRSGGSVLQRWRRRSGKTCCRHLRCHMHCIGCCGRTLRAVGGASGAARADDGTESASHAAGVWRGRCATVFARRSRTAELLSPPAEERRIAPENAAVGVGCAGEKRGGSGRSVSSQSVQRCG